ncbi:MAG: Glycosyl transferase family 2 [uncultured bacterium]|nr:MAG: Glycosyl transferase family 2 [uncultured bacterium]
MQKKPESLRPVDKTLSIILVSYENPGILRQCLTSIIQQNELAKNEYEIIVIDNSQKEKNRKQIKEIIDEDFEETTQLIQNERNVGFPKAVNQGIRKSGGRYLLILNPDITVLKGAIDRLINFLDNHQNCAIVSPRLVNPRGNTQNSCFSYFTTWQIIIYRRTALGNLAKGKKAITEFTMADWDHNDTRPVAWALGSSMMIKREAIDKVGLMDERFFMYMEDLDWCRRFWRAGMEIYYYPKAQMVHYYQRESASESSLLLAIFNRQTRVHIRSAIKYFWKYRRSSDRDILIKINNFRNE